jgi:hypothetical protein
MMRSMNEIPTNQPANHDHGHDRPTNQRDHVATNHPTMPEWVTLEEAAAALGITVNAVRQRMKRETLPSVKTDEGWLVDISATDHRPSTDQPVTGVTNHTTNQTNTSTDQPTMPTNQSAAINLAPLAEVIQDQNRRLEELSAAAAYWQVRAHQAEDQLKQLTAGGDTSSDAPGSSESASDDANGATVEGRAKHRTASLWQRLLDAFRGS